jgi:Flp pilus assembly protein CpaB
MKKNLIPLLCIAFVVAILSTAIFYGIVSSQIPDGVHAKATPGASPEPPKPPVSQVPAGMRAVSVQVADSSGILSVLQPRDHVDIQAVYSRTGNPVDSELKTVLQNIEVLKVSTQPEASPGRHTLPVVTFLTTPADSDVLALADSAARIRIALRHAGDRDTNSRLSMAMSSLLRGPRVPAASSSAPRPPAVPQPVKPADSSACAAQQPAISPAQQ